MQSGPCCRRRLSPSAESSSGPMRTRLQGQQLPVCCSSWDLGPGLVGGKGGPLWQELLPRPSSPPRPALLNRTRALCSARPRPSHVEARGHAGPVPEGLSHLRHASAHLRQAAGPAAVDKRAKGRCPAPRALSSTGSLLGLPHRTSTPSRPLCWQCAGRPPPRPCGLSAGPPALAIGTLLCVCFARTG